MATVSTIDLPRIERKLLRATGRAIGDFGLIAEGDHILVGLSGGKDSYTLLVLLKKLQERAPIRFIVEGANVDPGFSGYRTDEIERFANNNGVKLHSVSAPIAQLIETHIEPEKPACPLCSRMRRGALYTLAQQIGANKLALGHHLDDVIETVLMNMLFAGTLRGMPPFLRRDEEGPDVIRPLCYALEQDIADYARASKFPIVQCPAPHCDCADNTGQRQTIKRLLNDLQITHKDIKTQMRKALGNVQHSTLLEREKK